jgi:phage FluMu protein Com
MAGWLESPMESRTHDEAGLAFRDIRCLRCGRLLLRWDRTDPRRVEVKCPRCQQMNLLKLEQGRICWG